MKWLGKARRMRRESRHWDDPQRNSSSLGCGRCSEFELCGGLHVRSSAFDCLTYCCGKTDGCVSVCPNNNTFVDRVRELEGFELHNVRRTTHVSFPLLPASVPLIYSRGCRRKRFRPAAVGLLLYRLIDRATGELRFADRSALCQYFGIDSATPIFLTGTAVDKPLERWWSLGAGRRKALANVRELGIVAATTPNYSVFSDVPRWDNFHAMKRIAICWQEMTDAGLQTALHVNARTQSDWRRWTEFVQQRPEVTAIAYEFATGAAGATRMAVHIDELRHLADRTDRPLALVVRGGLSALSALRQSYSQVTLLDSTTYMRTVNRIKGSIQQSGSITWKPAPERPNVNLDELLEHNYRIVLKAATPALDSPCTAQRSSVSSPPAYRPSLGH